MGERASVDVAVPRRAPAERPDRAPPAGVAAAWGVDRRPVRRIARPDSGFGFVEVLVSIVLIGTVVIATLVALRVTIAASQVSDDRSRLLLWLNEGAEAVHRAPFKPCASGVSDVKNTYQVVLDAVPVPAGFSGGTLLLDDPEFLSIHPSTFVERWGAVCDPDRRAHRLTMRATTPDGSTTSVLEVVVND